ncbi:MAG TPA: serine protease [Candidatus Acidoferrales bacterium]|nr:serine protease [Candidatus Acidoferrales bacterium]
MLRRKIIAVLFAFSCLSSFSPARQQLDDPSASALSSTSALVQDFNHAVVPLTALKLRGPLLEADFGTGFCLDADCQFIGTNYHVAVLQRHLHIKGVRIVERYLATGPKDDGASLNHFAFAGGPPLRFTLSRDLAILQLSKPLPHHHGLQFSSDDLRIGDEVDIYAYPKGIINPIRSLQAFHAKFRGVSTTELMVFDYVPNRGELIRPGASGGVVVDSETGHVVGILSGIDPSGQPVAMAVPVESLKEFVERVNPFLAQALFPLNEDASPDLPDFHPRYELERVDNLQRRPIELDDVSLLRHRAQALAEGMRDFIAVQTYTWGSGNHHLEAADSYEVQVRDGSQMYREYPDGKKWLSMPAIPGGPIAGVTPTDSWSTLPLYVGTKVGVNIREAPESDVDGHRIRVFQYTGSAEDEPCQTRIVRDFGLFSVHKDFASPPYGEVWTDERENIVRMSLHCEKSGWGWGPGETIVTYGWLTKPGDGPRLVPVTILYKSSKKKLYWCRGQFVNYREFISRPRLLPGAIPVKESSP